MEHVSKEKVSKSLGVKYIYCKGKNGSEGKYITETGVVFTNDEITGTAEDDIRKIYEERLKFSTLYDYEYAKTTNFIRKKKNNSFEPPDEEKEMVFVEKEKKTIHFSSVDAILIIIGLAASGAVVMSAHYTGLFLSARVGTFLGYFQSITMVLFATVAFEAGFLFIHKRGYWILIGVVFLVLWAFVASYSMFTTMSVNYDAFGNIKAESAAVVAEDNSDRLALEQLDKSIADAEASYDARQKAVTDYMNRETYSMWAVTEYQKAADTAKEELKKLRDERTVITNRSPDAVKKEEIKKETFFDLLSRLFGWNADMVLFLINTLPAVFLDIVAPFGFAIVIFLKGENDDAKKEKDIG